MKRALSTILFLICIFILCACESKQTKDFFFDGEYPPLGEVAYTVDGKTYNITAFEGQCILFFNENIVQPQAETIIKEYGGKIIEQVPAFNYYLVEVDAGNENEFIARMREREDVIYTFLNTPCELFSHIYILDNFNGYREETALVSHGADVKRTFLKYGMGKTLHPIDIGIPNSNSIDGKKKRKAIQYITAVNQQFPKMSDIIAGGYASQEIVLINMSFGPRLYGKNDSRDLIHDVKKVFQEAYIENYSEELKALSVCFKKMRSKGFTNFIVTKASGNEGYHQLDDIINSLDDNTASSLKKNMVLVNAYDEKDSIWYTNLPQKKNDLTTTINISSEDWSGTSCAAPKLLGFIDRLMTDFETLNAQDVLQVIRNATPKNPREPMTYEMLEREAKKLSKRQCKQYTYVLDMTSDYSGAWDLSEGKKKDVVKYYVHDTYSYEYLSGQKMAIDIENCTDYDMEFFLNAIETEGNIRPMRYYLSRGERQSFFAYNQGTMDIISVNKLEVKITTW